jgi:hypothetical protein
MSENENLIDDNPSMLCENQVNALSKRPVAMLRGSRDKGGIVDTATNVLSEPTVLDRKATVQSWWSRICLRVRCDECKKAVFGEHGCTTCGGNELERSAAEPDFPTPNWIICLVGVSSLAALIWICVALK